MIDRCDRTSMDETVMIMSARAGLSPRQELNCMSTIYANVYPSSIEIAPDDFDTLLISMPR